jgi:conjugal transfer pilin signal peptidase TrbI
MGQDSRMKNIPSLKVWLWAVSRLDALYAHLLRNYLVYIALVLSYAVFSAHYEFSINVSESLPGTLYLVEKGTMPTRNEYVAFYYPGDFIYPKGTHFLKRVAGIEGDVVTSQNQHYFVNNKEVGFAMTVTSAGKPIQANDFAGVIPAGHFYVRGDHPLSLDSRYKAVGLVSARMIIGRGFKVF